MVKYSSLNNKRSSNNRMLTVSMVAFLVAVVTYFALPLLIPPFTNIWEDASLAVVQHSHISKARSVNDCYIIATPPKKKYDTLLLECNPGRNLSVGQFVWYSEHGLHYMVGKVTSVQGSAVVATLVSTYENKLSYNVFFEGMPEKFSAVPLGGGALRAEVPADVQLVQGQQVRLYPSNQLVGIISGISLEPGSLVQRVYIRLPFSFERLRVLQVE